MTSSKRMTLVVAALAVSMAGGAFAQDRRDDRGPDRGNDRNGRYEQNDRGNNGHGPNGRNDDRGRRDDNGRFADRAGYPQPHAEWRRGGRVPTEYRGGNYVVNDWRGYQLQAPPRGYQWIGVGSDFVLAAVATGLIAQIVTGH
ncbi:RcnB family protein [Variovorax ginsengisoli]|uniref:Ni/Co efflux regulator RcnB n=1 Tax=Variovorax ginsengisoli TaxID=363844 RepID=A0ABT9S5K9_9BURK|nr:RcnB family protein [Variovorax ginsengisoli]MDP9899652.1 Ni/Co efflux regulator RcnB [Variovorax ginsengisoli]